MFEELDFAEDEEFDELGTLEMLDELDCFLEDELDFKLELEDFLPSCLSVNESVSASKGLTMPSPGSETLELDESHAENMLAEITANIPFNQNLPIVFLFIKNKIQKRK